MDVALIYAAAQRSGMLTPVTVGAVTVHCSFRAPDESVLDGFALSRAHQIDYPAAWLSLSAGDVVQIRGDNYQVLEVRAKGDGSEMRASLTLA